MSTVSWRCIVGGNLPFDEQWSVSAEAGRLNVTAKDNLAPDQALLLADAIRDLATPLIETPPHTVVVVGDSFAADSPRRRAARAQVDLAARRRPRRPKKSRPRKEPK